MRKTIFSVDTQADYSELVVVRSRHKNVCVVSIIIAMLNIIVIKWLSRIFNVQVLCPHTYGSLTDQIHFFFLNQQSGFCWEISDDNYSILSNVYQIPVFPLENLREVISYISPI